MHLRVCNRTLLSCHAQFQQTILLSRLKIGFLARSFLRGIVERAAQAPAKGERSQRQCRDGGTFASLSRAMHAEVTQKAPPQEGTRCRLVPRKGLEPPRCCHH